MNLSIQDGRAELWQWDTGVQLVMDEACEAVNLSEDTFGVTVDVTAAEDGKTWVAAVPDKMLQKPGDLICYAVQSTATGTITAAYRSFRVNRRPKPAGYVATPTEARTWHELDDKKIDAPQVAQVGEVLTVEEVDEDGKPIKWKTAAVDVADVLKYTEQELTIDEQTQARENIGAVSPYFSFGQSDKNTQVSAIEDGMNCLYATTNGVGFVYEDIAVLQETLATKITDETLGKLFIKNPKSIIIRTLYNADTGYSRLTDAGLSTRCTIHLYKLTTPGKYEQNYHAYCYITDVKGKQAYADFTIDGSNNSTKETITSAVFTKITNDFPVTITSTTTDGVTTYTADKTFAEIKAAYDSGANVYAMYYGNSIYPLVHINIFSTTDEAESFSFGGSGTNYDNSFLIHVSSDDSVSVYDQSVLTSNNIKNWAFRLWETLDDVANSNGNCYGVCKKRGYTENPYIPDNVAFPVIFYVGTYSHGSGSLRAIDADGVVWIGSVNHGILRLTTSYPKLPSPATAQPGQIVKVKSVDESGKITETETVDMPSQKALKWVTVHSSDLTETTRELIISTDTDGKSIADYNPIGLSLIVSTPADATQESNNGAPWIYPSATKFDNAIRVIGSISGWKTIARDCAFVFIGGSSAMSCSGNVSTSLSTYKLDGYALDGVRIFFNIANDHFPVGTHVEVAILCEVKNESL